MILPALVAQLGQRFQHEKRAQVCLWFDERQEFGRLLPPLREYLAGMGQAPFRLFEYDGSRNQGQVWLKYQVCRALEDAAPEERSQLRFVLYLPLPEDRLETAAEGAPALDLLAEYRIAGELWRVGGKRPTLFSFLRLAGVALTEGAADQRRLYDGGRESILAKYVAKFVDRPAVFWTQLLTPELAQSRLVGDVDQAILDLATDPEGAWRELAEAGLDREVLQLVAERYGFERPMTSPAEWVRELVAVLALTETYLGYGEPDGFPFASRLPPLALRPHHTQLLQRWLRDTECRAAWDRWVAEVETQLDLTAWAKGREGLSFGLPHLVRARWNEVRAAFEAAAGKTSTTAEFFERHTGLLDKEAEYARASGNPVGSWELLGRLGTFLRSCDLGLARAEQADRVSALARVYVDLAATIEGQHLLVRYDAEEQGLEAVTRVADRAYAVYTNALNARFFPRLVTSGAAAVDGIPSVGPRLEQGIWKAAGKRAVIIVDALRYDCALAIGALLRESEVEVEPLVALLPTVTPIGMTALLPLSGATVGLQIKGNALHPTVNGKDMSVSAQRRAYLQAFGADCQDITEIEGRSTPPDGVGNLLVVFGHEEVDHIGHGHAQTLVRHIRLEIERLGRLVRKLHRWGYAEVHVVTDHGFILLDEDKLPEEVPCEREWCQVSKERYAIVFASADVPVATFPFAWDPTVKVAVPPGLSFFKAEKSFSHGGAALQELIIPHLVSRSRSAQEKRIGIEVILPTRELTRTAVKVGIRPVAAAPAATGQMALFTETGRTVSLDVFRTEPGGRRVSVLASGAKELRLEPRDTEQAVTLFFHTAASFRKGETLDLDVRDTETTEQFPPGGIKLAVGRDM